MPRRLRPSDELLLDTLREMGGLASARAVADRLHHDPTVIRDALVRPKLGLKRLGAGFVALPDYPASPLLFWIERLMTHRPVLTFEQLLTEISAQWPHPDLRAIRAWLRQDPGRLRCVDQEVRFIAEVSGER
jgi:hypothetical protein